MVEKSIQEQLDEVNMLLKEKFAWKEYTNGSEQTSHQLDTDKPYGADNRLPQQNKLESTITTGPHARWRDAFFGQLDLAERDEGKSMFDGKIRIGDKNQVAYTNPYTGSISYGGAAFKGRDPFQLTVEGSIHEDVHRSMFEGLDPWDKAIHAVDTGGYGNEEGVPLGEMTASMLQDNPLDTDIGYLGVATPEDLKFYSKYLPPFEELARINEFLNTEEGVRRYNAAMTMEQKKSRIQGPNMIRQDPEMTPQPGKRTKWNRRFMDRDFPPKPRESDINGGIFFSTNTLEETMEDYQADVEKVKAGEMSQDTLNKKIALYKFFRYTDGMSPKVREVLSSAPKWWVKLFLDGGGNVFGSISGETLVDDMYKILMQNIDQSDINQLVVNKMAEKSIQEQLDETILELKKLNAGGVDKYGRVVEPRKNAFTPQARASNIGGKPIVIPGGNRSVQDMAEDLQTANVVNDSIGDSINEVVEPGDVPPAKGVQTSGNGLVRYPKVDTESKKAEHIFSPPGFRPYQDKMARAATNHSEDLNDIAINIEDAVRRKNIDERQKASSGYDDGYHGWTYDGTDTVGRVPFEDRQAKRKENINNMRMETDRDVPHKIANKLNTSPKVQKSIQEQLDDVLRELKKGNAPGAGLPPMGMESANPMGADPMLQEAAMEGEAPAEEMMEQEGGNGGDIVRELTEILGLTPEQVAKLEMLIEEMQGGEEQMPQEMPAEAPMEPPIKPQAGGIPLDESMMKARDVLPRKLRDYDPQIAAEIVDEMQHYLDRNGKDFSELPPESKEIVEELATVRNHDVRKKTGNPNFKKSTPKTPANEPDDRNDEVEEGIENERERLSEEYPKNYSYQDLKNDIGPDWMDILFPRKPKTRKIEKSIAEQLEEVLAELKKSPTLVQGQPMQANAGAELATQQAPMNPDQAQAAGGAKGGYQVSPETKQMIGEALAAFKQKVEAGTVKTISEMSSGKAPQKQKPVYDATAEPQTSEVAESAPMTQNPAESPGGFNPKDPLRFEEDAIEPDSGGED